MFCHLENILFGRIAASRDGRAVKSVESRAFHQVAFQSSTGYWNKIVNQFQREFTFNYQNGNIFIIFVRIIEKSMRVIAKKVLREFWERQTDAEEQLKTWYKEASKAIWFSPNDIKSEYSKASILKSGRVVFNLCGNKYRLIVRINYTRSWVFIRFIGTHAEYDKIDADNI